MTSTPVILPVLVFHGREAAPFTVGPGEVPQTPRGRGHRLARAAAEALPRALALRDETLAQLDDGAEVVVLVCAVDCPLGRQLVERRLGPLAPLALCGPAVFVLSPPELAGLFGAQAAYVAKELAALDAQPSEPQFAFAVNGMMLDVRVLRHAAAPVTPASAATEPPLDELPPAAPPGSSAA